MYQAFKYRKEVGKFDGIKIPCEATVRRHYWNQSKRRKAVCFGDFWLSSIQVLLKCKKRWFDVISPILPIFKFSTQVRKVIYTTNAIESLNSGYRLATNTVFYHSCWIRACWHYFSHVKMHAIWTNDRKITSSLSYLVHTLRNAFSHRNSLSIIFLCLYSSWSYSHGFMRFFFGGTTGLCPKDWQSSLVLSPS